MFPVDHDEGLEELAGSEHWDQHLHCPITELTDSSVYKKMLAKIFLLKDMWRHREPKVDELERETKKNYPLSRPRDYFATPLY